MTAGHHFARLDGALGFLNSPIESKLKAAEASVQPQDVSRLTSRMSRGEEAAFREFYDLYSFRLLRYLTVVANGREEIAREALQYTFVRVARYVRRFDSEPAFWNWLAVLARNCVRDEDRKNSRYHNLLARFFQQRASDLNRHDDGIDEKFLEFLESEIDSLPEDDRALIKRKYFNGETARRLAEEWQITEKAMESRLLRIRKNLKDLVLDRLKNEKD